MKISIKLQKEDQTFEMAYQLNLKKNKPKLKLGSNQTTLQMYLNHKLHKEM